MHSRGVIAAALAAVISVAGAASAQAGGKGDARTEGPGVAAEATSEESAPRAPRRSGGGNAPSCMYRPLSADDSLIADFLVAHDGGLPNGGEGAWYGKICVDERGRSTGTVVWFRRPRRSPTAPAALAEQALRYAPIPLPDIRINPPPEREQLVGLPVWLWLDEGGWKPVSATASAGGVTVTVTAVPERVLWDMGEGDVLACGPGTAYDPARRADQQSTDCSHTYRRSSATQAGERYRITAVSEWHATWTVTGAPGGGDLGVIRRSATIDVTVAEAQAVNTKRSF